MNNEQFKLLTEVAADKPMGKLMRKYWHPVALSSQVPEADAPPLITYLLNERLVVFRDSNGKVGVLDDHCLHRGVSLGLGRVEEGGIRCIYHGWKFDVTGQLLEAPNHDNKAYISKKKARSFPVQEASGMIWTYIGPADEIPDFRKFEFDNVPEEQRVVFRANSKAPYLLLWEGGVDSSHVGVLHTNVSRPSWGAKVRGEEVEASAWDSLAPTYELEDTDYGFRYVAFRQVPGDSSQRHARQVPAMMPNMRIIPGHADFAIAIIEVPMKDDQTATYQIVYSHREKIDKQWAANFLGFVAPIYDEKTCNVNMEWPGSMFQDRSKMGQNFSGFVAIEAEDVAMALSLAEPWDRSKENLVAADIAVMRLRQMLLNAVKNNENDKKALGVEKDDMTDVVAYDRYLSIDEAWKAV